MPAYENHACRPNGYGAVVLVYGHRMVWLVPSKDHNIYSVVDKIMGIDISGKHKILFANIDIIHLLAMVGSHMTGYDPSPIEKSESASNTRSKVQHDACLLFCNIFRR